MDDRRQDGSATEQDLFREVFRRWAGGVAVVSACDGARPHGMLVNSLASVSVVPPQVVFSAQRGTRTYTAVERSGTFAASFLANAQRRLLDRFTGADRDHDGDRFHGLPVAIAVTGAPVLLDALAWIDCRVAARHDGPTYTLFVGEVVAASLGRAEATDPLIYFNRQAFTLLRARTQSETEEVDQPMPDRREVARLTRELTELRERILAELVQLDDMALETPTDHRRWSEVRRVLLRLGDHPREHAVQIGAARDALGTSPTMTQRILAQAERSHGELLAVLVGLCDADLDRAPAPGEWSVRQTLEHLRLTQMRYLETITRALGGTPEGPAEGGTCGRS